MDEKEINEKPMKHRKGLSVFFNILIVFLSLIALAVAGVLIYQKRYLTPFWVHGQSMYPTLNRYAEDKDHNVCGENGKDSGIYNLDYIAVDTHERARKNLKRFNVINCYYSADDKVQKIKRVIGLPGETIKFGQGDDNGTLYVKEGDSFVAVEQPIENRYVTEGYYPNGEITLGSDEYYVCGDNRIGDNSSDSRKNGPIKYSWIVGKVVCVCAHCDIELQDGAYKPVNIHHFIPRFL